MRRLLVIPPILVGGIVLAIAVNTRSGPVTLTPSEAARPLRVIPAPEVRLVPRAVGYGTARPSRVWRAEVEVAGTLTEVHPQVRPGGMLPAGAVVARIDSTTYSLNVRRLEVEIKQVQAQLLELEAQAENLSASRAIEEAALALAERDLERIEELSAGDAASQREVDETRRSVLAQRQSLQSIVSNLNLIPAQRSSLQASLAVKQVNLEQARSDLGKTVLHAPFACRVGAVELEVGQLVKAHDQLFECSGTARVEVEAQVLLDRARTLFGSQAATGARFTSLDMSQLVQRFGLQATVRFTAGPSVNATWEGRVERIREAIDQETRTLTFVVVVDDPLGRAVPGKRPPLVSGMFCEVELRAVARPPAVVVPLAALHEDAVYVLDAEHRLRRREVGIDLAQDDLVRLDAGLEPGERVVVSDPTPAIEGMLVDPTEDSALLGRLLQRGVGK